MISDIASALEEQFPDHKLVGRVGGDEFLVLMDNTTLKQAEQKAKELADMEKNWSGMMRSYM